MLSFSGARQISGKSVMMSMRMGKNYPVIPSEVEGSRRESFKVTLTGSLDWQLPDSGMTDLLHNFERGALIVAGGGAGE